MLNNCLRYYGINEIPTLARSLNKLQEFAFYYFPNGYTHGHPKHFSKSYSEIQSLLEIPSHLHVLDTIQEIFRYGVTFGLIRDLVITPYQIEWKFHSLHQRDLFFAKLKIDIRENIKISSLL